MSLALVSRPILPLLLAAAWLAGLWPQAAGARSASLRVERISTAVATLEQVRLRLTWPPAAAHGRLRLQAARFDADALGYHFRNLDWRCGLRRDGDAWRCSGPLRSGAAAPLQLSITLGAAHIAADLQRGDARIGVGRSGSSPDAIAIDLRQVPLAWAQAMLAQAWPAGRLQGGTLDGRLTVATGPGPVRIEGPLELHEAAVDSAQGRIAAAGLDARLQLDARLGTRDDVAIDGAVLGGELLFGSTYVSLQQRTVPLRLRATREAGQGWRLPRLHWRDTGILVVEGQAAFTADTELQAIDLHLHSADLAPLGEHYLSTWLGLAGLGNLQLSGRADARVRIAAGELREATVQLHDAGMDDPRGRFAFRHLRGDLRFSTSGAERSALQWSGGTLYGLGFGGARLPFASGDGRLRLAAPVSVPVLGGQARFDHLQITPPAGEDGLDIRFGLALQSLDVAQLSKALDWPAFSGRLSGRIPQAHYRDDRLDFNGGLDMQLFGGDVAVSALAMERPFGVAPTLAADIVFDGIGLEALTGAFDFGTITGKLDGRIDDLRLVNWQPVAFDAWLATDPDADVRQRISQRAVQDLSSVGDASFVTSLQSQLIGFFDDFGYRRIGIGCELRGQVCTMQGLGAAGEGFTIVRGSGLPRLTVVGFNRRVDWPTLVERLSAIGTGDVKPVVD